MNDIKALFEIDFQSVVLGLITFMIGFIALRKIFVEFLGWLGIETKFMRDKREQKEDIEYLKKNNAEQDKKIDQLMDSVGRLESSVDKLSKQVENMQEKLDTGEAARLRDRISQAYHVYKARGRITTIEKEALMGLIEEYRKYYSTNTFVNEKVYPFIMELTAIDE